MSRKPITLQIKNKVPDLIGHDLYITVNKFTLESLHEFRRDFYKILDDPEISVIPVIINSYGGSVEALLAMIDIIQACPKPVATIANGPAMSCGAVLLAAGTEGYRFAAPNSRILVHQMSGVLAGKSSDLEADYRDYRNLDKLLDGLLDKLCKKPVGFFNKIIAKNKYADLNLTPKQAKKYGMVDYVALPVLVGHR